MNGHVITEELQCTGSEETRVTIYFERGIPFTFSEALAGAGASGNDDSMLAIVLDEHIERFSEAWERLSDS